MVPRWREMLLVGQVNLSLPYFDLDVEMSIPAQLVRDVSIGVKDRCPIGTCLCSGGNIMSREKIIEAAKKMLEA